MPKKRANIPTTRAEELEKHALQTLLMEAAIDCLQKKNANNGRLPHGYMTGVLKRMGHPKLNRDMVNYQIAKIEQARSNEIVPGTPSNQSNVVDDVSALTSPSMFSNSSESSSRAKGGRPKSTPRVLKKEESKKRYHEIPRWKNAATTTTDGYENWLPTIEEPVPHIHHLECYA